MPLRKRVVRTFIQKYFGPNNLKTNENEKTILYQNRLIFRYGHGFV
jgi:hypothetical protein